MKKNFLEKFNRACRRIIAEQAEMKYHAEAKTDDGKVSVDAESNQPIDSVDVASNPIQNEDKLKDSVGQLEDQFTGDLEDDFEDDFEFGDDSEEDGKEAACKCDGECECDCQDFRLCVDNIIHDLQGVSRMAGENMNGQEVSAFQRGMLAGQKFVADHVLLKLQECKNK